jgi:hypothetical protein
MGKQLEHGHGWEMLDRLVVRLEARGLAIDSTVQFWPGDKAAAKVLGVPEQFVSILWSSAYVLFETLRDGVGANRFGV